MRKIIAWIAGGLGNQLFQFAAARSLANDLHAELVLDTAFFFKNRKRSFKLSAYNVEARKTNLIELAWIKPQYFQWLLKAILKENSVRQIDENSLETGIRSQVSTLYMRGYWQNENYFSKYRNEILTELSLKISPIEKARRLAIKLSNEQSVSIHIRRGDYVSEPEVKSVFGVLSMNYYEKAIEMIRERIRNPRFYIFSDDIEWARQNFFSNMEKDFIDIAGKNQDVNELWLMNHCKHNIIANSSFSWWGAWAGTYPEKVVIAPRYWSNRPLEEFVNIVPSRWIRIDNK